MAQFQQLRPSNGVLETEGRHLTRRQLNCQRYAIQLSAHFRDKWRLLVGENEASRSCRHASYQQLRCRISKHGICRLLRAVWWKIKGRNPGTMLASHFQQFATRGQKIDLLRFLVELLGKQRDRLDHVFTAIENDQKPSRTNEVDQLQARIFRFECKSQGCRDSPRNMPWIGNTIQINKMDFPAKLLGNGQGNGRLANAAGAEQCYEPLISKLVANLADDRFAPYHHNRSHGEPALVEELGVPAFGATWEGDNGADERIAPSLNVGDVAVAKLAVAKRLAERGHVDPEAPLLNGYVRPDVTDDILLRDDLTRAVGEIDQNIQRPPPQRKHLTVAPEHPLANRKFERTELQLPINCSAMHVSAKRWISPAPQE